ncbi:hypothetical protein [Oceanobacillus polygoni]|uniref:Uncharacterized protein n=1 Tax=Oceanobacillus polygoni TaxID=1235259 RepID=A0A9X0YP12_9BACI|nr:hypothetical protein [Oceanobacillus polygoni]MBP2076335.1 hypothetical protein [Oceanobacillus polygoni]
MKKVIILLSLALLLFFAQEGWVQSDPIEMATEEGVPPSNEKEPKPKCGE